jgi:hypothetical protein
MKLCEAIESTKNVRKELSEQLKQEKPLYETYFQYQSEAYFESFRVARKLFNEGRITGLDKESIEMLKTDIGESVTIKGVGKVYLDSPYIRVEEGIKPIPGLVRAVAAALGITAAAWLGGEVTSAKHTPLGQAMEQAAQEGDQIAKKYLPQLDFISEENPALLAKLSKKYHVSAPVEESVKYYVYTKNPQNNKVRKITFAETDQIVESTADRLKPAYWQSRLHRYKF